MAPRETIDAIPWTDERGEDLAPVFETGGRLLFGAGLYAEAVRARLLFTASAQNSGLAAPVTNSVLSNAG